MLLALLAMQRCTTGAILQQLIYRLLTGGACLEGISRPVYGAWLKSIRDVQHTARISLLYASRILLHLFGETVLLVFSSLVLVAGLAGVAYSSSQVDAHLYGVLGQYDVAQSDVHFICRARA
jgi:hypothetical protein